MKFAVAAFALILPAAAFALAPPPPPEPIFIEYLNRYQSLYNIQVQLRTDGSILFVETNRRSGEQELTNIGFLSEEQLQAANHTLNLVNSEMDFRSYSRDETEINQLCPADPRQTYWVVGKRFHHGQKVVIQELGCGVRAVLADAKVAEALHDLRLILDRALAWHISYGK